MNLLKYLKSRIKIVGCSNCKYNSNEYGVECLQVCRKENNNKVCDSCRDCKYEDKGFDCAIYCKLQTGKRCGDIRVILLRK